MICCTGILDAAIDVHSTFAVALALSQSHSPLPDDIKNFENDSRLDLVG